MPCVLRTLVCSPPTVVGTPHFLDRLPPFVLLGGFRSPLPIVPVHPLAEKRWRKDGEQGEEKGEEKGGELY